MKTTLVILTALIAITTVATAAATAATINVPADQPTIQAAIDAATDGDTVIVAQGMYNEQVYFYGKNIYLVSTEPTNSDVVATTIINAGGAGSVVVFEGVESSDCRLDGFTITGGGNGGILGNGTQATITRCLIKNNYKEGKGGGVQKVNGKISHCKIIGNTATNPGGGLNGCHGRILHCVIAGNTASIGGAMRNCDGGIVNCTIVNNVANSAFVDIDELVGGIIDSDGTITNCIIWGNSSVQVSNSSTPTYSCIQNWQEEDQGNISDDPAFVSSEFYELLLGSPCIDAGTNTPPGGLADVDIESNTIPHDGDYDGIAVVDMGAYEVPVQNIIVLEPEEKDIWSASSVHTIKWSINDTVELVTILLTDNNGDTWQTIAANIPNSGTYQWHLPDVVDSDQCMVKVVANDYDESIFYVPSRLFTIHPTNPDVKIDSPWPTLGGSNARTGLSTTAGPEIGCIKWQFPTTAAINQSVTIGAGDNIHIPTEDGTLYTITPEGDLLWTYNTASPITSPPAVGPDGTIFVGCLDGRLHAIDKNGSVRWTHSTGEMIFSTPAVNDDGNIFVASTDGTLYAISHDGSEPWTFTTQGPGQVAAAITASPAIGLDGTLYVAGIFDPTVYALDPTDGTVIWSSTLECTGFAVSPVVGQDALYLIPYQQQKMIAISLDDGSLLWEKSYDIGKHVSSVHLSCYLKMDERNEDRMTSYGDFENYATLHNFDQGDSIFTEGIASRAIRFDGIDDYIETNEYLSPTRDFSVFFWIKSDTQAGTIIGQSDPYSSNPCGQTILYIDSESGYLAVGFGATPLVSDFNLCDGNWHHIGFIWDGARRRLFADGVEIIADVNDLPELASCYGDIYVGADKTLSAGSFWSGLIDEFRIYNYAFASEDIDSMNMPDNDSDWDIFARDLMSQMIIGQTLSEPVIGPDGTIYLSPDAPYFWAFNPDGSLKWFTRLGPVGNFSLSISQNNLIYAACDDGSLYVIDADGNVVSRFTGSKWLTYPVIAPDGTVYLSDSEGILWAISPTPVAGKPLALHRPYDITADGNVDLLDFAVIADQWLKCSAAPYDENCDFDEGTYLTADINRDLYVDLEDFVQLAVNWLTLE